jgi:hypothetical protein
MDEKKILLVNLSKGKVGEINAKLLGLIIVSKIQMAALSRANVPEGERQDFYLYVDEFQNFITDAFESILSEARKYRLNLVIAHQYLAQLESGAGVLAGSVPDGLRGSYQGRLVHPVHQGRVTGTREQPDLRRQGVQSAAVWADAPVHGHPVRQLPGRLGTGLSVRV